MANHPNRNWRRRWSVDLDANEARHTSGLTVRFQAQPDGSWQSVVIAQGQPIDSRALARLTREAGDIFQITIQRRDR